MKGGKAVKLESPWCSWNSTDAAGKPFSLHAWWAAALRLTSCRPSSFTLTPLRVSSFYFQWFQSTVSKEDSMPETLKSLIFPNFEPLHKFHTNFLKEIEQRLALWWVQSRVLSRTTNSFFLFLSYFYVVPYKQHPWAKIKREAGFRQAKLTVISC